MRKLPVNSTHTPWLRYRATLTSSILSLIVLFGVTQSQIGFAEDVKSSRVLPPPSFLAYLTSWGLEEDAHKALQHSQVDGFILSFARWDDANTIVSSDGLIEAPSGSDSTPSHSYRLWTQLAHGYPDQKFIISFGGQAFADIWQHEAFLHQTESLAERIAALLTTKFPVFDSSPAIEGADSGQADQLNIIGFVELDGVDFDFEQEGRLSVEQNARLIQLIHQVRSRVRAEKLISLTTYHVGADPVECQDPKITTGCSFVEEDRSIHHGEVIQSLHGVKDMVDFFNVMTYDAGKSFLYDIAMENHAKIVGSKAHLRLGLTINRQWSSDGGFVMANEELVKRAKWVGDNRYGGAFVWALGANTENLSLVTQIEALNQLKTLASPENN